MPVVSRCTTGVGHPDETGRGWNMRAMILEQTAPISTAPLRLNEDGRDLLTEAAEIPIRPRTTTYALSEANRALQDLKNDQIQGTGVLVIQVLRTRKRTS